MKPQPVLNAAEIIGFLGEVFPQAFPAGAAPFEIETVAPAHARVAYEASERDLRPGDTVSGPTLMMLADVAMYVLVLAHIGRVELAVTTNLSIDFLRRPEAGRLFAEARLLKLGKRLAVGDVLVFGDNGPDAAFARASCTYSIPADR